MNGELEFNAWGKPGARNNAASCRHHPLVRWTVLLLGLVAISLLGGCVVSVHGHHPHRHYEYEYHDRHDYDRYDYDHNGPDRGRYDEDHYRHIEH